MAIAMALLGPLAPGGAGGECNTCCFDYRSGMVQETAAAIVASSHDPGLAIDGRYLYAALGFYGLQIFDLADPAHPTPAGQVTTLEGDPYGVAVDDNRRVYLLTQRYRYPVPLTYRLEIVDATDPGAPAVVSSMPLPSLGHAIALDERQDHVYITGEEAGIWIVDVRIDQQPPHIVATLDTPGIAWRVAERGDLLFVAARDAGLHIADVSIPEAPRLMATLDTPGSAVDVAVAGNRAYVADDGYAIQVVDITDPGAPAIVGHGESVGASVTIEVAGGFAYLRTSRHAVEVFQLANESRPPLVGTYRAGFFDGQNALAGDHAYVLTGNHLFTIDITSPRTPVALGSLSPGVAVEGHHAYVADQGRGLSIFDVSDRAAPRRAGGVDTRGWAYEVVKVGNRAYLADGAYGLAILDVTDPTAPVALGSAPAPGGREAFDIAVGWGIPYAYLADDQIQVFDIRDKSAPTHVRTLDTPGDVSGLALVDRTLYASDRAAGVLVYDLTDPASPALLGTAWAVGSMGIAAQYPLVVAMPGIEGGIILPGQCRPPSNAGATPPPVTTPLLAISRSAPRPGQGIDFELRATERTTIRLYDVSGRLIRRLVDVSLPAGRHQATWDGRSDAGVAVASGVYL